MTAVRVASLSRMRQSERCASLEAELAEVRAEAEVQKRRANTLESKLALLASSMEAVASDSKVLVAPEPSLPSALEGSTSEEAKHVEAPSLPLEAEVQSPKQLIESLRQARLASIGGAAGELKALVSRALAALSPSL